jgi:bacterioferritin (cytochrome b1)
MSTRNDLVAQLNGLLRLTQTETMIAETRRAQAATEAVERELAANADKCRERSQLLTAALRDLGGVPDVVGVGAGRLAATVKSTVEQGQDLVEALFGDLALENELLARTRYARMIAERHGETRSLKVLDRLEEAHTATVQWLMTRLGEVAVDAPPSLRPTPMQTVAGISRRIYLLPAAQTARLANRGLETSTRLRRRAGETATTAVERSRDLIDAAGEVITAGRDAALKRTEEEATELGATRTARNVNRARRDLGAIDGDEVPIRNYDSLTAKSAIQRIDRLRDVDDLRAVLAYEAANKARKGVTNAIEGRVEHLVAELADAS